MWGMSPTHINLNALGIKDITALNTQNLREHLLSDFQTLHLTCQISFICPDLHFKILFFKRLSYFKDMTAGWSNGMMVEISSLNFHLPPSFVRSFPWLSCKRWLGEGIDKFEQVKKEGTDVGPGQECQKSEVLIGSIEVRESFHQNCQLKDDFFFPELQ